MIDTTRCSVSNGSYTCRREQGHDGFHSARYRTAGEWRLAIFADKYSAVETVRSAIQNGRLEL